jgi:hypothetical protein
MVSESEKKMKESSMRWNRSTPHALEMPKGVFKVGGSQKESQPLDQSFYRLIQEVIKRKNAFMQKIYHGLRYQELFANQGRLLAIPNPSQWQQHLRSDPVIKEKLRKLLKITLQLQQQAHGRINYVAIVNAQLGDIYRIPKEFLPDR